MVTSTQNSQDNYQIDVLSLDGIDLRNEFLALAIYENIFVNDMNLSMDVMEVKGFFEVNDIQEGAVLKLKYFTRYMPFLPEMGLIDIEFYFYKRERVKTIGQGKQIYRLHFSTKESHKNQRIKISRSYRDKTTSEIVESAFGFLESDKPIDIEPTDDFIPLFVVPNLTPYQVINLANRSALKADMNDYVFYRDKDQYVNKPVSVLMEEPVVLEYIMDQTSLDWTHDKEIEHLNIIEYHQDKPDWNSLENIDSGYYGSRMFVRNVLAKTHEFVDFKGKETEFSGTDNLHINESDNYYNRELVKDYRQDRLGKIALLNEKRIIVVVPDNSDLTVGKMVHLKIPTNRENSVIYAPVANEDNVSLTGDYLITKLKHEISAVDSTMVLEVIKKP